MKKFNSNVQSDKFQRNKDLGFKRKKSGRSLIELMAVLLMVSAITFVIVGMYSNTMSSYIIGRNEDKELIEINEALMYIDYYVNYKGEKYYIEDGRIYIEAEDGGRRNYIYLESGVLKVRYREGSSTLYRSQPLLYDVKNFNLSSNNKVIFVEIISLNGNKLKKAIGSV